MAALDSLERHRIGGADQWLMLRGDTDSRRVLLFLHGGPGMPVFDIADRMHGDCPKLGASYLTAFWEQRGTGKSMPAGRAAGVMTIERFVADAIEVAELLAARFRVSRVHLMGHSWGSVVGALAAARRPDLFAAYVGVGQVTDFAESERRSYAMAVETARRDRNAAALRALERIGPPPHGVGQALAERKCIVRLGGNRHRNRRGLARTALAVARNRAYVWRDVARMLADPLLSMRHLWPQLQAVDLFRQAPRLDMPVFLLAGRHDMTVPSSLVEDYFAALQAPSGKQLVRFEHSAHVPFAEEPAKFELLMCGPVARISPGA